MCVLCVIRAFIHVQMIALHAFVFNARETGQRNVKYNDVSIIPCTSVLTSRRLLCCFKAVLFDSSVKEVVFSSALVSSYFVCLLVTQKLFNRFSQKSVERLHMGRERNHRILVINRIALG